MQSSASRDISWDLQTPEKWGPSSHGSSLVIDPPEAVLAGLGSRIVVDVENTREGPFVGLGLCDCPERVFYFTRLTEPLKQFLTTRQIVGANVRTDLRKLRGWGVPVRDEQVVFDTQLASHLLDSARRRHGLKELASDFLGMEYPTYEAVTGGKRHFTDLNLLPVEVVANYNGDDVLAAYKVGEFLESQLGGSRGFFEDITLPLSGVLNRMEERGVRVNLKRIEQLGQIFQQRLEPIKEAIRLTLGDINLDSPKQLWNALAAKDIRPLGVRGKLKGKPSTDKSALEKHRHKPVVQRLLRYSQLSTLISNFINPYLERGVERVHPEFKQTGTRTGRLSCKNPNLQQIPRRTPEGGAIRSAFVPADGSLFWDADFGQIEPRIMAHASGDERLVEMFQSGINFHTFTAQNRKISREKAKVLNLSVGYRATAYSVMQQLGCSESEAQAEIDGWWEMFPGLRKWEEDLITQARATGHITTLYGRKIKIDDLHHGNQWCREASERDVVNNFVQGSAAEVMQLGMIQLDRAGHNILVQVHDEVLAEEPITEIQKKADEAKHILETCVKLDVPLTVDMHIGRSWQECK